LYLLSKESEKNQDQENVKYTETIMKINSLLPGNQTIIMK